MLLTGKVGIVFGVSSRFSLGFHIAKAWTEAGASRVVLACETKELCDKVQDEAKKQTWWKEFTCITQVCNVNSDSDVSQVFSSYQEVDMIQHSVAHAPRQALSSPLLSLSRHDFLSTMETSAYSLLAIAQHAKFSAQGGSLTSLTFAASQRVVPGYAAMAPAKSALETLSLYLAAELGEKQIRCNCISAGIVNTPAARAIPHFHDLMSFSKERNALKRTVLSSEVASLATFLASDQSRGITGQVIKVDAGDVF